VQIGRLDLSQADDHPVACTTRSKRMPSSAPDVAIHLLSVGGCRDVDLIALVPRRPVVRTFVMNVI